MGLSELMRETKHERVDLYLQIAAARARLAAE
jgi:hypothetical protein